MMGNVKLKGEGTLSFGTLWIHLQKMLQSSNFSTIYIVVDALDEGDNASRNIEILALSRMAANTRLLIKIVVTARPETEIEKTLGQHWQRSRIDTVLINIDLMSFINPKVRDMVAAKHNPETMAHEIKGALTKHASGTFLWSSFVLQDLSWILLHRIRQALKELPRCLDEVYHRILRRIIKENREDVRVIVTWITTRQAAHHNRAYIKFRTESQHWADPTPPTSGEVFECSAIYLCCQPLVYRDSEADEILLVHQSVKVFLTGPPHFPGMCQQSTVSHLLNVSELTRIQVIYERVKTG